MSYKVTNINARKDRAGKHNDRNFNLDSAPHINQEKSKENLYWTYLGDIYSGAELSYKNSFSEIEKEFYEQHFSQYIDTQNKKNEKRGQKKRNKTIDDYRKGKYTRPEDKILQIGNADDHIDSDKLWECALEYTNRFNDMWGDRCKILDMALHVDEETPHVHIRRVWLAESEDGLEQVSQSKSLEKLGYSNENKFFNGKKSFTEIESELFLQICEEHGIDIQRPTHNKKQHNIPTSKYKVYAQLNEIEKTLTNFIQNGGDLKTSDNLDEIISIALNNSNALLDSEYINFLFTQEEINRLREKRSVEIFKDIIYKISPALSSRTNTKENYIEDETNNLFF